MQCRIAGHHPTHTAQRRGHQLAQLAGLIGEIEDLAAARYRFVGLVQQIDNVGGAGLVQWRSRIAVHIVVHRGRGQTGNAVATSPDRRGLRWAVDLGRCGIIQTAVAGGGGGPVQIVPGCGGSVTIS